MGEDWMEEVAKAGGWKEHRLMSMQKELELKKKELEILKELSKISPEQWTDIKESTHNLKLIVEGGGVDQIILDFKGHVVGALTDAIEGALTPIYNEIDTVIGDALGKMITDLGLDDFINDVATFIGGNQTGAFFGAMVGSIKGPIGAAVGAVVGAYVEVAYNELAALLSDLPDIFGVGRRTQEEFMLEMLMARLMGGQITQEEYWEAVQALLGTGTTDTPGPYGRWEQYF